MGVGSDYVCNYQFVVVCENVFCVFVYCNVWYYDFFYEGVVFDFEYVGDQLIGVDQYYGCEWDFD